MTFGEHIRTVRTNLGLSQTAFSSQGFVSLPGWIKIENGQRQPSEKVIEKLVQWMVAQKYIQRTAVQSFHEELLTLKYMESNAPFLRELAREHAKSLPNGAELLAMKPKMKARRGRPPSKAKQQ